MIYKTEIIKGELVMNIIYKGKLTEKNKLPKNDIPKNSIQFLNPKSKIEPYLGVIPILLVIIVTVWFKRNFIMNFTLDIKGMFIGLLLTIPLLILHEFLHALCLPKHTPIEMFWSPAGIMLIPCKPISKLRYSITLIVPAIILGLIPLFIWTFIPFTNITLSSVLFLLSIANLGGCSIDVYNLFQVIRVMPKGSQMITSETNCYYF